MSLPTQRHIIIYIALALIISLGAFMRLHIYLSNPSLAMDDAAVALNLNERSYDQLLRPLDHEQVCPIGFLYLTKLCISPVEHEYTLRLPSLIMGLANAALLVLLGRLFLTWRQLLLVLLYWATAPQLISYSVRVKPYIGDIFWSLLIYLAFSAMTTDPARCRRWMLWPILCITAVWFSFPVIFVIAATGMTLLWHFHQKRQTGRMILTLIVLLSGVCLAYFQKQMIRPEIESRYLLDYWRDGFMPNPTNGLSALLWPVRSLADLHRSTVRMGTSVLGLPLAVLGVVAVGRRAPRWCFVLLAPLLSAMACSAFRLYPFQGRMLIFATPAIVIFTACGISALADQFARWAGKRQHHPTGHQKQDQPRNLSVQPSRWVGHATLLLLIALIFLPTGIDNLQRTYTNRYGDQMPIAMIYLRDRLQPDDAVICIGAHLSYPYYAARLGIEQPKPVYYDRCSRTVPALPTTALRYWLLLGPWAKPEEQQRITQQLQQNGYQFSQRQTMYRVALEQWIRNPPSPVTTQNGT